MGLKKQNLELVFATLQPLYNVHLDITPSRLLLTKWETAQLSLPCPNNSQLITSQG